MGFFSKKPDKAAKMRVMKVTLERPKRSKGKGGAASKKAAKPMSFNEWVEHYAKMSGGNPV